MDASEQTIDDVVVRFAGDSGDGMQITGTQFSETAALAGNDIATFPDYPAEIRAPAGTLAGVSGFQVHFASHRVFTPGDAVDCLVAMNPAALRANLSAVRESGALLVIDPSAFSKKAIERAGYASDPREDGTLERYRVIEVRVQELTLEAVSGLGLTQRAAVRCKNMFALGLIYWLYGRAVDHTLTWLEGKFRKRDEAVWEANVRALKAGHAYGETHELSADRVIVPPARVEPGLYRNVSGNDALAFGLAAASELSGLPIFYGSYPITPASPILHHLSRLKSLDVRTFQAEDEIAAACAVVGAAYAGALAVTGTSGPGLALKAEALALGAALELPMIFIDVQRAGPSTGMPTKTEQADLLQALYGRHGESPVPVLAARSPSDCFDIALLASRIAIKYMTPVIILSDAQVANGAEPWLVPHVDSLERISVKFAEPRSGDEEFLPYARNADLARPWAVPGTPGLEHRVGGLEKADRTGHISYDPENHERMTRVRAEKVERASELYPETEVFGKAEGKLLVVGWGGTYGVIREAVTRLQKKGASVSHVHLRGICPLPRDFDSIARRFESVLVPELNTGQLATWIAARLGLETKRYNKIQGQPFTVLELETAIERAIEGAS